MRKITFEASKAFMGGYNFKSGNTKVERGQLFLHGHKIAEYASLFNDGNKDINITNAGWSTTTTKERLNGLVGIHIVQKAGVWYLNGIEWTGAWVTVKENGAWSY